MTFGRAIECARNGDKISRFGWNGKEQYVFLVRNISFRLPNGVIMNAEHDAIGNQAFAFFGTSGIQIGWLASQADMLADDWHVID